MALALAPRPYQQEAFDAIMAQNIKALVKLPTGCGKTLLFPMLARHKRFSKKITLILAEHEELLEQARDKILRMYPNADVGIVGFGKAEWDHRIILGGVDTLSYSKRLEKLATLDIGLVICDECFPAGTLVDGRPIETLKVGDTVTAFDEKTQTFAQKRITSVSQKSAVRLLKIIVNGASVVCTPNHPFYTESGWKYAENILVGERILYANLTSSVPDLRATISGVGKSQANQVQERNSSVLLTNMHKDCSLKDEFRENGEDKQEICFAAYEKKQSDAQRIFEKENEINFGGNGTCSEDSWGQRKRINSSAAAFVRETWLGTERNYCENEHSESGESRAVSNTLQGGHWQRSADDSYRNRWGVSLFDNEEKTGREENEVSCWKRVDGIEVYEPGSDGTFGGLCPGGSVYNFEVEDLHTYTANGFVVHNCHHAVTKSYLDIFAACKNAFLYGNTATVDRHDQRDITAIFGPPVYSKSINEMIDAEYLCGIVPFTIRTQNTINVAVSATSGDYSEARLEQAVNRKDRNDCIVRACCEEKYGGPDLPTVVFCAGTQHAKEQALAYVRAGIPAAHITMDVPKEIREQHYADFATGAIKVLTNVQILTEGWDADVRRIVFARPTKSRPLFTQMLGRGTRIAPGKEACILLDFTDNYLDHDLEPCTLEDVLGVPVREGVDCREVIRKEKEASGGAIPEDGEEKKKREKQEIDERNKLVEKQLTFRYKWQQVQGGAYIATVGDKRAGGDLILYPSKAGGYIVGVSYKETPMAKQPKEVVVARNVPLSWAQSIAEQQGKNLQLGNYQFIDPDAPWRKSKPSQAQLDQIKMLSKATYGKILPKKNMTKGEASELISKGFALLQQKGRK